MESGVASTPSEALKILLEDNMPRFKPEPWQGFRDELLWTNEIDNLLKPNMEALGAIHDKLFPKIRDFTIDGMKALIDLLGNRTKLAIPDKETKFCFGMSKMTVKDEIN